MKSLEKTAKTVDEAIWLALQDLKLSRDQVEIEVIDVGSKGFLGFGARPAKVMLREVAPEIEQPVAKAAVSETATPITPVARPVKVKETVEDAGDSNPAKLPAQKAQKFMGDLLHSLDITCEIRTRMQDGVLNVNLEGGDELGLLIGKRGVTLDALQYLTSLVANKGQAEHVRVVVNIGDYRKRREETLARLARRLAQQVEQRGVSMVLEPMTAQERRIIHLTLQDSIKVVTYSEGEEPYRKVVIAPK